jgi:hypothetical protein
MDSLEQHQEDLFGFNLVLNWKLTMAPPDAKIEQPPLHQYIVFSPIIPPPVPPPPLIVVLVASPAPQYCKSLYSSSRSKTSSDDDPLLMTSSFWSLSFCHAIGNKSRCITEIAPNIE